jgi:hypothetical protein
METMRSAIRRAVRSSNYVVARRPLSRAGPVAEEGPLIDQAADALRQALALPHGADRWPLLDEALRLTQLAVARGRDKAPGRPPGMPFATKGKTSSP